MAARTAAPMPSMIVPRRVANNLLDRMLSTFLFLLRNYRVSTDAHTPNRVGSQNVPLPETVGSVYSIQWPQIAPFGEDLPTPGNGSFVLFGGGQLGFPPPVSHPVT